MKKVVFSALAVMAVGAAVMGGQAYSAYNDSMSELFLGGAEQIAQAEDDNRWDEVRDECFAVLCTPQGNEYVPGQDVTCKSGTGPCQPIACYAL